MDFEFSEEQKLLERTLRQVVAKEMEPVLNEYPADEPLPKEVTQRLLQQVQPLGYFGARIPEQDDGAGLSHVSYGIFEENFPSSIALTFSAQETTTKRIHLMGNARQRQRFLPSLLSVQRMACSAISEPDVGSDIRHITTQAVPTPDGKHYKLRGTKLWVTNGTIADIVIVVAATGKDDSGKSIITPFVVEREESPFQAREVPALGLRQSHWAELVFDDTLVPAENMLGEPGHAHRGLTFSWLAQRPGLGLKAAHCARKALEMSLEFARNRRQFGRPIGSFQLIQQMLSEMATLIDASRLLCYRALSLLDQGVWCHKESSMAKWFATEMCLKVTSMGIQIHGALGLTQALGLERLWRDARMFTIPDGTTEIHHLIIGRELTGMRAYG